MPLGHAPLSLVAASGKHQLSVDAAAHRAHKQMVDLNPGQTERVTVPPLAPSTTALAGAAANLPTRALAPAASGAPAVPSPGELLARARSLVQAGQWQQAVVAYRKLRRLHPKSPESHTVLVALGQLELDRLGQPAQALGFFNRYLRFGGGLAQEAAFGKVRALRALGNVQLEGKAIEAYVARYPGSADARALRRRLADLGRADSKRR
jgi:tetratricopeptide (TPR) repeat protein